MMKFRSGPARWARLPGTVLIAIGAMWAGACGGDEGGAAQATTAAQDSVVYVDVRSPEEFASGHVAGAINIPHTQMGQRWTELAEYRDQPMVVYCRSGRRSGIALDVLREHGFDQARNGGGLQDLARRGVPTTR